MDLKDIVTISGKSGLYKIVQPTRVGFVLEAMDGSKGKMATNPRQKVSVLDEISIYTDDTEGSIPLKEVLDKIYSEYKNDPGINSSASPQEMRDFLRNVVPNYDDQRVYTSDIKKLITWYSLLTEHFPDIFQDQKTSKEQPDKKGAKTSIKAAAKTSSQKKKAK